MSVARAISRPRSRATRLLRTAGVPPSAGSEGIEVAASVGGVLLGALLGDMVANRMIRDAQVEPERPAASELELRLVRIENVAKVRTAEERRSSYVVIGSMIGGIVSPFLARAVLERRRP